MSESNGEAKRLVPVAIAAIVLLGAGVAWKVGGSRPRGYEGEPAQGLDGMRWGAASEVDLSSSEGASGAMPAEVIVYGFLKDRVAQGTRLESFFRDEPSDPLWGLPAKPPQYLFHQSRLCAALVWLERPCEAEVVARLGPPHERVKEGPFESLFWHGHTIDIEYRYGAQLGIESTVMLLTHRPTIDALAPKAD